MGSPLHKYFKAVRLAVANISNAPELYYQHPGRDFTRRRLLPAERTVWLVLSLLRLLLKHLEPLKINNRPRQPRVMRVGERHCWEGNYRHAL